ncbi:MAG: sulfite exporter TauE/SafE family protein [Sphingomonas bacterium]|uniref:sulfite exporter TauE/SafE family protein n=1 Tax=Sphingomonas bacterium TaxID=1895847 RepID=UPI0026189DC1|nr:sulfite exporter TauE/SafE family protein [Sphingomonas bacterium]MDB5712249.1 sulfite exporter TauE/SafE family protein [Sphingomonas bacterium]
MAELSALAIAAGAGLLGGTMNALAGGGTFATMPTLIALGLPSPIANATSNVALQPGAIASAWAYRDGLEPMEGIGVRTLAAIAFVGGLAGGLLLVATPTHVFDIIIPWLLLLATLALAFGRRASAMLRERVRIGVKTLLVCQILLGIYGGYFGGGVGLMMTATWGLLAGTEPHRMAAPRTLMLAMANAAAAIIFILSGMVQWLLCVPMLIGATAGGYLGARLGRILSPAAIRLWTLLVTAATTAAFFWRAYA